jgi:hypothetical protein
VPCAFTTISNEGLTTLHNRNEIELLMLFGKPRIIYQGHLCAALFSCSHSEQKDVSIRRIDVIHPNKSSILGDCVIKFSVCLLTYMAVDCTYIFTCECAFS